VRGHGRDRGISRKMGTVCKFQVVIPDAGLSRGPEPVAYFDSTVDSGNQLLLLLGMLAPRDRRICWSGAAVRVRVLDRGAARLSGDKGLARLARSRAIQKRPHRVHGAVRGHGRNVVASTGIALSQFLLDGAASLIIGLILAGPRRSRPKECQSLTDEGVSPAGQASIHAQRLSFGLAWRDHDRTRQWYPPYDV
jgi:hypothetical protein